MIECTHARKEGLNPGTIWGITGMHQVRSRGRCRRKYGHAQYSPSPSSSICVPGTTCQSSSRTPKTRQGGGVVSSFLGFSFLRQAFSTVQGSRMGGPGLFLRSS